MRHTDSTRTSRDVRDGSSADIAVSICDVCFTPESGHSLAQVEFSVWIGKPFRRKEAPPITTAPMYSPARAYDVSVRLLLPFGYVDTERRVFVANLSGVFVSCRIVCF